MDNIKTRLNISDTAIVSDDVLLKYSNKDNMMATDDVFIIIDTLVIKYLNYSYYIKLIDMLNTNNIVPTLVIDTMNIENHIINDLKDLSYNVKFVDCHNLTNNVELPRNIDLAISKINSVNKNGSKIILCDYSSVLASQFVDCGEYFYIASNKLQCTHHISTSIDYTYNLYNNTAYVLSKIYELDIVNINIIFLDNYETSNMFDNISLATTSKTFEKNGFRNNENYTIIEADNIEDSVRVSTILSLIGCNIVLITKSENTAYIDSNDKISISYNVKNISKLYNDILKNNPRNVLINIREDGMSDLFVGDNYNKYTIDRDIDGYKTLHMNDKVSLIKEFVSISMMNINNKYSDVPVQNIRKILLGVD